MTILIILALAIALLIGAMQLMGHAIRHGQDATVQAAPKGGP